MLPKPRVAAIDDEPEALIAIADALNSNGAACLKLLYAGRLAEGTTLKQIRVLLMDLHLSHPSGENKAQHFSTIGGILHEYIEEDNGPFLLIVWTLYPQQVEGLGAFLCERLQASPHAIPAQIRTLSKIDHIRDSKVVDPARLVDELKTLVQSDPQIAALVNWENRVNSSASATIAAVLGLVPRDKRDTESLVIELDRLLNALATQAVGASNVSKDRFAAVSESLLPILYDRVSRLRMDKSDEKLWGKAISKPGVGANTSSNEAAQLNSMLHVDFDLHGVSPVDRGVVLEYPVDQVSGGSFRERFGMTADRFLKDQLGLNPPPALDEVRLLLVQVEGVCDHAQAQPGPSPFLLGVECSASVEKSPQAVWQSPLLWIDSSEKRVYVNFRFGQSCTKATTQGLKARFRFREALTNDLVSRMHSYGARPGIISFRGPLPVVSYTGKVVDGTLEHSEGEAVEGLPLSEKVVGD
jgi:hypothetical protein